MNNSKKTYHSVREKKQSRFNFISSFEPFTLLFSNTCLLQNNLHIVFQKSDWDGTESSLITAVWNCTVVWTSAVLPVSVDHLLIHRQVTHPHTQATCPTVRLSSGGFKDGRVLQCCLESVPLSGMEKSIDVLQHTVIHIIWNLHIHNNNDTRIKNQSQNYTI